MTITKKTMLLGEALKKVTIDTLSAYNEGNDGILTLTGNNLDGAKGYHYEASSAVFEAKVSKNGGTPLTVTFASNEDESVFIAGTGGQMLFDVGDQVTVSFDIDDTKSEYEQGTVSKTIVVP